MAYSLLVSFHVAAGTLALLTFWVTAALRKGTRLHRRVGGTYLLSMVAVLATTPILAGVAVVRGDAVTGAFLAYLTVITATAVWSAWRAIRDRAAPGAFFGRRSAGIGALNLASGAAVLVVGLRTGQWVLVGMSLIGLSLGANMLRQARRPPTTGGWWLRQHYGAILGCGIATHIAFLNIGLQRLWPGLESTTQYLGWFGPPVAAVLARLWLDRRYGRGPRGNALAAQASTPGAPPARAVVDAAR